MLTGLTRKEAARRLAQEGPNVVVAGNKLSGIAKFLGRFRNPLVLVLLFAAAISAVSGDAAGAGIIIAIVFAGAFLDFINTYKSEKAADALKKRVMITTAVIRDGVSRELPVAEVVRGDLIALAPGDIIPADGKIIQTKDFFANESALTGESFPVEKKSGDQVFMGASAVTGSALMEATATGAATKFGAIAETLARREAPTEFDRSIKDFSVLVMKIAFALVIVVFFINAILKHSVLESLLFAIALAVGITPELLPMIIALNLSKGSLAMAKEGVIVKKLSAIQNFGSMDVFCTDKTGTLTEDKIALVKYVDTAGVAAERVLLNAFVSSAFHVKVANPFDTAIRRFEKLDVAAFKKIDDVPFDFLRKRDAVIVEREGRRRLITKGAPEEIFAICVRHGEDGKPFDAAARAEAEATYGRLSDDGFRVLAVAVRDDVEVKAAYGRDDERDLSLLGFVAFLDPAKKTASETIKHLIAHGVEIKIVTGDNDLVTKKIAKDVGLPIKGILTGDEVAALSDEALRVKAEQTTIFARVTPMQKLRVIQTLQRSGHVVGYMGDGINDAPALKAADVGISVNNAVDVAKESADLILLRKSLRILVRGIEEGRRTFANTMKYLMMSLSSNFGNMFSMAGASLLLPFLPMLPTQILFNNLLYDASQFTIPLDDVDHDDIRLPRKMRIEFIRKFMFVFGPLSSVFDFITFGALYWVFHLAAPQFQTGSFLESLATQQFVIYVIRTRKLAFIESMPGKYLVASTLAAVAVGTAVALTPIGALFHFQPLTAAPIAAIAFVVAAYLVTVEIAKRRFFHHLRASLAK